MAELLESTAIVPSAGASPDYTLTINEFDAAGAKSTLAVPLPKDEKWGNVLLRAALLKKGGSWKTYDIPTIIYAVVYADNLGLDIMAGDVFMATEGRLSTTADAKIKHALASGRLNGYEFTTEEGPIVKIPWKTSKADGVWEGPNYKTTVTVHVKGWEKPLVYTARLKEWFTGANPNWRDRTVYMLEKNAVSKALALVAPMGVEADEAPPQVIEALATAK